MSTTHKNYQSGFSIVTAIFTLVILSLLGLAMVNMSIAMQQSSGQTIQGVQAYYAAKSGMEWAVYNASSRCLAQHGQICSVGATTTSFTVFGYAVTVSCDDHIAGGFVDENALEVDNIMVTATNGMPIGSPDRVSRTIRATVTRGDAFPC